MRRNAQFLFLLEMGGLPLGELRIGHLDTMSRIPVHVQTIFNPDKWRVRSGVPSGRLRMAAA
jgi:hypothetical protein